MEQILDFCSITTATREHMDSYNKLDGELLFYLADATWRSEAMKVLGQTDETADLAERPEAQGEPATLLRIAYEARQRALTRWKAQEGKL